MEKVYLIEQENQAFPKSQTILQGYLSLNYHAKALVLKGILTGFIVYRYTIDEGEILNLSIAKAYQKQGLGTYLLQYLLKELLPAEVERVYLEVRVSNISARGLYEKLGFHVVSLRPKYYPHCDEAREDALIYILERRKGLC